MGPASYHCRQGSTLATADLINSGHPCVIFCWTFPRCHFQASSGRTGARLIRFSHVEAHVFCICPQSHVDLGRRCGRTRLGRCVEGRCGKGRCGKSRWAGSRRCGRGYRPRELHGRWWSFRTAQHPLSDRDTHLRELAECHADSSTPLDLRASSVERLITRQGARRGQHHTIAAKCRHWRPQI